VGFRRTLFKGRAYFVGTEFVGYAWFSRTTFSAEAFFERTKFHSGARFAGVEFQDIAIFSEAKFERASFLSVKFTETADFSSSWFASNAHFTSCQSDLGFFLIDANFAGEPPNFTQATFKQAPDLDSVVFPVPRFWKGHNKGRVAVYRAIRRVSVQGHDQENEAKAFKGEVRSKRGTEHRWYHAAFWYGVAYDGLSDFGSSLSRPLLVWLFSVVAFGAVYLWNARVDVPEWVKPCRFGEASKALRAFTLSIANALPVIGSSRSEEAKAFYSCVSSENIPVWSPIIQIGQTLWSAVLIFLFLLAVRNQFKIK